jgi:hypothetical protein
MIHSSGGSLYEGLKASLLYLLKNDKKELNIHGVMYAE